MGMYYDYIYESEESIFIYFKLHTSLFTTTRAPL
jgi:hypothetical protein